MSVLLTWHDGSRSFIAHVESVRVMGYDARGCTTVEIKTYGNEPALNRGVVAFTVEYGESR